MSFDVGGLNWLAILAGALIYFALGALWYAPAVLGRPWMRSIGWDPEKAPPQMSVTTYLVPLVAYVIMAIAVGMIAAASGSDGVGDGIVLGLVVGIGLAASHTLVDASFDPNKPSRGPGSRSMPPTTRSAC